MRIRNKSVSPKESRAFITSPASFEPKSTGSELITTVKADPPSIRRNRTFHNLHHLRKMGLERDLSRARLQPHLHEPIEYSQIRCQSCIEWWDQFAESSSTETGICDVFIDLGCHRRSNFLPYLARFQFLLGRNRPQAIQTCLSDLFDGRNCVIFEKVFCV